VRVIATSRELLSVPGEHVLPVPPLRLPASAGTEPLSRVRQNEAVMLFVERAAAASGSFEVIGSNQDAVVEVCRQLDGLPLAIELAAVRTRALTPEQIREGPPQTATAPTHDTTALLGRRATDVARLVADGLSNKEIGARLFISERTVESHVRNILNKLGFTSRAQIAGWIATPGH
jgi:predicted ATPase